MGKAIEFLDKQIIERNKINNRSSTNSRLSRAVKRTFDIVSAALGLLFLSPLFLYAAIRIKRDSPGPVFYHGPRMGYKGKVFRILKFRTMYECPESYSGALLTAKDDNRITPLGAWLRDTKLNEFPQLWNVLVGEMSFVGPRPEDPEIVTHWPDEVRAEVLSVRPGITSPASVTYRDEQEMLTGQSVMDEYLHTILPNKLRLDQLYVRHHSFLGDLDVIFMTLTMLFPVFRTKKVTETTLFEGPLTWFARKYVSWLVVDSFIAFFAISLAVLLWRVQAPLDVGFGRMVAIALGLAFGLAISNTIFGLKRVSWRNASPIHVFDLALSTLLALFLFSLFGYIYPVIRLPIALLVDFGIFSFFGSVAVRYRERLITGLASRWIRWRSQSSLLGERVLVIGAGNCGQLGIWLLEKSNLSSAFSIVGIVDDDFRKQNQRVNGYPVLGTTHDIPEIVAKKSIGLIMYAINNVDDKNRDRIIKRFQDLPVRILMIPDLLNVVSKYFMRQKREV